MDVSSNREISIYPWLPTAGPRSFAMEDCFQQLAAIRCVDTSEQDIASCTQFTQLFRVIRLTTSHTALMMAGIQHIAPQKTALAVEEAVKCKYMTTHCCHQMTKYLSLNCVEHSDKFECPDVLINYIPKFDEYGLIIHDGGNSVISIAFCPWCSMKLPESKRDLWFDKLEELGYDDPSEQDIPTEFKSEAWYANT